jgi:transcriptional regulator with XRE-family HTH domain
VILVTCAPSDAMAAVCSQRRAALRLAHATGQKPLAFANPPSSKETVPWLLVWARSPTRGAALTEANPMARRHELGTRLRVLRNERGLTVEGVAAELLCSPTKISRLETGARRPSLRDVRDLCALYKVDKETSAELMRFAEDARKPGWWAQYEDLNLEKLIGLEQEATAITGFSMSYIPGLLQTEEYARGIIPIIAPKMNPEIVEQRVEARMRRQQILEQDGRPYYLVLLDEAIMHRGVGGPAVMAAQLRKVLDVVQQNHATVQVIPFTAGAYTSLDAYFALLEFEEDSDLWPVVFVEGLAENKYFDRKADVARYRETIEYLCDRAFDPRESVKLIDKVRQSYAST